MLRRACCFDGNFSRRSSLFAAVGDARRAPFFIHNGHQMVMRTPRKPHIHAALECKPLNVIKKVGRIFFNRLTKKAFANSTYLLFVQTIHNVIHKDCGQYFRPRLRFVEAFKCDDANLLELVRQFKVSRFF